MANREWCDLFHGVEVLVGVAICSDHSPIFALLESQGTRQYGHRKFRYEAGWELNKRCHEIIEHTWRDTTDLVDPWKQLFYKMEGCKNSFLRWQSMEVGKPNRFFTNQCNKLAEMQGQENVSEVGQVLALQKVLQVQMEQEELRWKQRAKVNWLSFGDRNSKFFHACANHRRKVNKISQISDERGDLWRSQEDI